MYREEVYLRTQRDRVEKEVEGDSGWGGVGGGHVCTCSWFMLMYGKNHHTMVK